MKYARIVGNKVWETFVPHSGATIQECFTPDIVAQFISCPDEVENTWTYENGSFIQPVVRELPESVVIPGVAEIVDTQPIEE